MVRTTVPLPLERRAHCRKWLRHADKEVAPAPLRASIPLQRYRSKRKSRSQYCWVLARAAVASGAVLLLGALSSTIAARVAICQPSLATVMPASLQQLRTNVRILQPRQASLLEPLSTPQSAWPSAASPLSPIARGRRDALAPGLAAALLVANPKEAVAKEPRITERCAFDLRIGQDNTIPLRRVVIGLFVEEAPILTRNFIQACQGKYPGDEGSGLVNYRLSDVKTIVKDRSIRWAKFQYGNARQRTTNQPFIGQPRMVYTEDPLGGEDTRTTETNELRHDILGRVSMPRGGGTFDFNIAPVANATWLDDDNVVIGQVLEGLDVIEDINQVPCVASNGIRDVLAASAQFTGDTLAQKAATINNKPLKKVKIFESCLL